MAEETAGANNATTETATEAVTDYSAYVLPDGGLNTNAIDTLVGKFNSAETSKRYFQSELSKARADVPTDDLTEYGKNFKPNEAYARFMDTDEAQAQMQGLREWAKENGIGKNTFNKIADYCMTQMLEGETWDTRSQEQIDAENIKAQEQALNAVKPMLDGLGRTYEENNQILNAFVNSENIFSANPQMMRYFEKVADDGAEGYMFATLLTQAITHSGVPSLSVPTATATIDKSALDEALAKEKDPNKREAMVREYWDARGVQF